MPINTEEEFEERKEIYKKIAISDLKKLSPINSQERKDALWKNFVINPLLKSIGLGNKFQEKIDVLWDSESEKDDWFDKVLEAQENYKQQKGWSR